MEELARRSDKLVLKEKTLSEASEILYLAMEGLDDIGPAGSLRSVIRSAYVRILDELKKYRIIEIT